MSTTPTPLTGEPEYAWEVATLHPEQGEWSEDRYLELTDGTNRLIEFTDGRLEFLPMPTEIQQALVEYLHAALKSFVEQRQLGKARFVGIRLRVRPGKIREPDVLFLHRDNYHRRHNRVWDGADLVMEVVSPDRKDRVRDYEQKLADYAQGGIAEYWIADPERRVVTIYRLHDGQYALHGEFSPGQHATSVLLEGFALDVAELFAAADDVVE